MNASEQEALGLRLARALSLVGLEVVTARRSGGNLVGWVRVDPTAIIGALAARQFVVREAGISPAEVPGRAKPSAILQLVRRDGPEVVERPDVGSGHASSEGGYCGPGLAEMAGEIKRGLEDGPDDHPSITNPSP